MPSRPLRPAPRGRRVDTSHNTRGATSANAGKWFQGGGKVLVLLYVIAVLCLLASGCVHLFGMLSGAGVQTYDAIAGLKHTIDEILSFGPRVAGSESEGHIRTRELIHQRLAGLQGWWNVEWDSFTDMTPVGPRTFHNIIGTLSISKLPDHIKAKLTTPEEFPQQMSGDDRILAVGGEAGISEKTVTEILQDDLPQSSADVIILAAHYDSKLFTDFEFVGAIDSVVSCALLLELAANLTANLKVSHPDRAPDIKLVFFDGEEAYKTWSESDSIYGARHLAKVWEDSGVLDRVDLFVLLDLIGTKGSQFYSFFQNSYKHHMKFVKLEKALRVRKGLRTEYTLFNAAFTQHRVSDDHTPFHNRGVPVLHIVPIPFPSVWHTRHDTADHLHYDSINDIAEVLYAFVEQYMIENSQPQALRHSFI
eukprot:TRINITY_DN87340_c0_g1_i1.p1 TRINITY_DN87340_c0_g1~~TRINITY_DN87340_c0_g1_i1.p1  ORF type:complete len:421 (-),score=17.60 TRINITY_DN87340_c0_g1_i1:106-1368(-)